MADNHYRVKRAQSYAWFLLTLVLGLIGILLFAAFAFHADWSVRIVAVGIALLAAWGAHAAVKATVGELGERDR